MASSPSEEVKLIIALGAAKERMPNAEIAKMSTTPSVMNIVLKTIFLMGGTYIDWI